jgi:quinol monooxygenase YgiN
LNQQHKSEELQMPAKPAKSDVIVIASTKAKPGQEKALEQALCDVAEPTRAQPGCVSFSLLRSAENPAVIIGIERWTTEEDHDRHLQGAHFQKLVAAMGNIVAGPPEIIWYAVIDQA